MQYLRKLMESKSITSRIPDQSLITSSAGTDVCNSIGGIVKIPDKIIATRDINRNWAFIYLTKGGAVTIDMSKISKSQVSVRWYNPRNGNYSSVGTYTNSGTRQFTAPSSGVDNDWVLVLD
jgi:hypothetical protein